MVSANREDVNAVIVASDDGAAPPRNTILHFIAFYWPVDANNFRRKRATADIVEIFEVARLIDPPGGKYDDTALAKGASTGNYGVAKLLLNARACTPLSGILSYAHREREPPRESAW